MRTNPDGISACLIVRDEEALLADCLVSIRPWVDEICVVDTGSADDSVRIALEHGARVEHFVWCNDFSAARNRCLEMARFGWVLSIDADERLVPECGPALREAISRTGALAFTLTRLDVRADGDTDTLPLVRLFRNDPRIRFDMPVHESVVDSLIALGCGRPAPIEVQLVHQGYLPEALARVDKLARNLAILREFVRDRPSDVFAWLKYAQTAARPDEIRERLAAFRRAHALAENLSDDERRQRPYLPLVYDGLAETLERATALGEAVDIAAQGLRRHPDNAELLYRRADLALRLGELDAADRSYAACLGVADEPSSYGRAMELQALWPTLGLARVALARGELGQARQLVDKAGAISPSDIQTRCLRVECMLAAGAVEDGLEAFRRLEIDDGMRSQRARLIAGDLAWRQGDALGAQQHWETCCACHEVGYLARCRIAMATWITTNANPVELLSIVQVRDLASGACALLLATAARLDARLDARFCADQVLQACRRWVDDFVRDRNADAHRLLLVNAVKRQASWPGLSQAVA